MTSPLPTLSRWTVPPAVIAIALLVYSLATGRSTPAPMILPESLAPHSVLPRYNDPRVATDEQLSDVLDRVKPPRTAPLTNNLIHSLRLWGTDADFFDPKVLSGKQMLGYLTDDAKFREIVGENAPPLLQRTSEGITIRGFEDGTNSRDTSSYHNDDLLATYAESGLARDYPLALRDDKATINDLLATSLRRFHLDRLEYEWTAITYARYVFPQPMWSNKFGETITLDLLIDELVKAPPEHGPCNGLHRLEAMTVLCRIDDDLQKLTPKQRMKMLVYMKRVSLLLEQTQSRDGFWSRSWSTGQSSDVDTKSTVYDKILVTGHQIEWLAYAPPEVQPPQETIVRAGQWLCRTLTELDDKAIVDHYGPYSHAARALCLWRSTTPYDAWRFGAAGQKARDSQGKAADSAPAAATTN
ncbi:hypothetical protein Psta_1090 [Pirellula staleyi DSM 6068]|uniref:Uncharacterized protein n=1 Tax=Pirellula staleyi (strain ATCC 27377 / DSM 6068 / ICPB 4128) TaxID=530564 RepID=D2R8F6_PIRSD|nr:hypothetical protein [Pirellula staleyi]ADB15773.1 hypothetical protein Psta_1090 [Pirellula staleyi DSM 6068]